MTKRRKLWILVGLASFLAVVSLVVCYVVYQTAHTGQAALERMSAAELEIARQLQDLDGASTAEDVLAILGPPSRSRPGYRPTWRGPSGSGLDQIAVYLNPVDNTVRTIRWVKIGSFCWEHVPK